LRSCAIEPLQGVKHRVGLTGSFRARRQTHTPGQNASPQVLTGINPHPNRAPENELTESRGVTAADVKSLREP
jgi:hypothetical protein